MRQLKRYLSDAPKPLLLQVGIVVLLVLPLWWVQQNNVNALSQRIDQLEHQINDPKLAITPRDKLALKKDLAGLEKDRVSLQNNIYTTLVQALGGAFLFVTAYLTWRNVKATEEKQVTERFSKAIEHLASKELEVRLGGIYALERIARDSQRDHWTIMEVLTAFVRQKAPWKGEVESKEQEFGEDPPLPVDVQAVLTVLGRRSRVDEEENLYLDLTGTDLRGLHLIKANLQRVRLGRSNLRGAILEDANLQDAILNRTNFEGAVFQRANLEGATLLAANLMGANLWQANLERAQLGDANLQSAVLRGANLMRAILLRTDLREANLLDVNDELTRQQINQAITDKYTELPVHLKQLPIPKN